MPKAKTKVTQKQLVDTAQSRDTFQTPNYGTDLLIPFIPTSITHVWECAAGEKKISNRLDGTGKFKEVLSTDLAYETFKEGKHNFLLDGMTWIGGNWCIITNPPFSLKYKFYKRCLEYKVPFALLIPADYCGWLIKAFMSGVERIIPTRRIDFITPSGKTGESGHTADFHSMWLTWGFGIGSRETFVELSLEEKKNNI